MPKRIAIMQPYFFPYIGYFQLITHVDQFVIYDDIKYTKKGWINRNRMLGDKGPVTFSLPLMRGADQLDIIERSVSDDLDANKVLRRFKAVYAKAPFYDETIELVERVFHHKDRNLFRFIAHSLGETCSFLGISTPLITSSTILQRPLNRGQERVIATCKALNADEYVNPQNGVKLYDGDVFLQNEIDLKFLIPETIRYDQGRGDFIENLSIIDVMMFNHREYIRDKIIPQCNIMSAIKMDGCDG